MDEYSITVSLELARRLRSSQYLKITTSDGDEFWVNSTLNYCSFKVLNGVGDEVAAVESFCPGLLQTIFRKREFSATLVSRSRRMTGTRLEGSFVFHDGRQKICSINKWQRQMIWYDDEDLNLKNPDWRSVKIHKVTHLRETELFDVYLSFLAFGHVLWARD